MSRVSCPGHSRHWFSFYGHVRLRSPFCVRGCGMPNPRPLTEDDWADLISYRELRGRPFSALVEAAIAARQAGFPEEVRRARSA